MKDEVQNFLDKGEEWAWRRVCDAKSARYLVLAFLPPLTTSLHSLPLSLSEYPVIRTKPSLA